MESKLKDIVESKAAKRRELAAKPVAEKLAIVEQLAERALATRPDSSRSLPDKPWEIPSTWRWDKMGNVAKVVGGGTPSTTVSEYWRGDIPWITPADLAKHHAKNISSGSRNISRAGLEHSGAQMLPRGAVLFSSRAPIGYVAIAANPVATNQGFKSFVLNDELASDFVYYYLLRARELAVALASGTTFLEISGKNAARLPIPIPPREEQRRIVAEIEKQFTRLDYAVASLEHAEGALPLSRAAILDAAFTGALIADAHTCEGWTYSSLKLLSGGASYGTSAKCTYDASGPPILRIPNIVGNRIDISDLKFAVSCDALLPDQALAPGDLLIIRTNGSKRLIGRAALVTTNFDRPTGYASYLIRFRLNGPDITQKWIAMILQAPRSRRWLEERAATSAGQHNLSLKTLGALPIPLPTIEQQHQLLAEVERRVSVADQLESSVAINLNRAQNLRQSILRKAFSGQL